MEEILLPIKYLVRQALQRLRVGGARFHTSTVWDALAAKHTYTGEPENPSPLRCSGEGPIRGRLVRFMAKGKGG